MQVDIQYAEENLNALAAAVDAGQEIEISRPDKPTLKLVVSQMNPIMRKTGKRVLGAGVGELRVPAEEEWRALDKEMEAAMLDAPLTTTGEI